MKIKYLFHSFGLLFLLLFSKEVIAQTTIKVTYYNQTTQNFAVTTAGKLYFNTTDLIVSTDGLTNTNIPINIIQKITFADNALGTETFEMVKEQWLLFPNPVSSTFQISSTKAETDFEVKIFNMNGKLVHKGRYNNNSNIDASYLSPGIYIAKVNNVSLKFVKKWKS